MGGLAVPPGAKVCHRSIDLGLDGACLVTLACRVLAQFKTIAHPFARFRISLSLFVFTAIDAIAVAARVTFRRSARVGMTRRIVRALAGACFITMTSG